MINLNRILIKIISPYFVKSAFIGYFILLSYYEYLSMNLKRIICKLLNMFYLKQKCIHLIK